MRPVGRLARKVAEINRVACWQSTCTDPFWNLALEDYVFRCAPADAFVLLLWRNSPCVVIGRNQNPWTECRMDALARLGGALVRRQSGGGTVYHDLGNSLYSVVMPRAAFTRDGHVDVAVSALQRLGIPAERTPRHDIFVGGRKISGTAYKLVSQRALHHGTLLISTDTAAVANVLDPPLRATIKTLGVQSVRSPVCRLDDLGAGVGHREFATSLAAAFCERHGYTTTPLEQISLRDMAAEEEICAKRDELLTWDWRYGQTPEFTQTLQIPIAPPATAVLYRHGNIRPPPIINKRSHMQTVEIHAKHGRVVSATANAALPGLAAVLQSWTGQPYNPVTLAASLANAESAPEEALRRKLLLIE